MCEDGRSRTPARWRWPAGLAPVHAWLLATAVAGAFLWRLLPPLSPAALAFLPPLLAFPAARRSLAGLRLGAAGVLVLLVIHGTAPGRPPRTPAARPAASALAELSESTEALLLTVAPAAAADLGEWAAVGAVARRATVATGWARATGVWRPLPGDLELWPREGRSLGFPADQWFLLARRPAAGLPAAAAAPTPPRPVWEPFRGPVGPFAPDPGKRAWERGRVGRVVLDAAQLALRPVGPPRPAPGWPTRRLDEARRALARRLAQGTGEGGPWLIAVLLGEQAVLPAADVVVWQRTGLAHLLAVSGLNVGVLAVALWALLAPLPLGRGSKDALLALLLLLYVPLAGWQVSVRRAVLMALLLILGRRLGRSLPGLGALALAAAFMLWLDPADLAGAGFQMSCGAVAALLLGLSRQRRSPVPAAARRLPARLAASAAGAAWQALRLGLLSQAGTAPTQLACFGALPLSGLLLNLAAVPLSSLLTVAAFLHLLLPLPGEPLGALCEVLARWLTALARAMPAWSLSWHPHPAQLALAGLAAWLALWPAGRARLRLAVAAALMAAAVDLLPRVSRPRPGLCLFDVGQGDALLLIAPRGDAVLVDTGWDDPRGGGRRGAALARAVSALAAEPPRWLVLSHPDQDHLGGAEALLADCPARAVLWNGEWRDNPPQRRLRAQLAAAATPLVAARPGQVLQAEPGWRLRVLGPPPSGRVAAGNERSVVLRLETRAGSALLTGDAGAAAESWLAAAWGPWLRARWLKLGHHGSRGSSTPDFLAAVDPREALISCGRGNRYGHPHPELLARLAERGVAVHRSDRQGWRWLAADGAAPPRRACPRPRLNCLPAAGRAPTPDLPHAPTSGG